jgi:hypothetical protein
MSPGFRANATGSGAVRLRLMRAERAVLLFEASIEDIESVVAAVRALAENVIFDETRVRVTTLADVITCGANDFSDLFGHGAYLGLSGWNVTRDGKFRNHLCLSRSVV